MIVTMLVSLYTVRIVLATLGEEDYGIYNVIGGVIVLFSFLNTAMNNATQRFLSYEIGRGDKVMLSKTFSMSINCHIILSCVILLLTETVGLWFVQTKLNIPEGRETAALWVYHFSIATFIMNILRVPYNASVISYEKMSFYAYLSIVDVILNLVIVYALVYSDWDKLILYAVLKFAISLICWLAFYIFCKLNFLSCRYKLLWDSNLYSKLMGFTGWSMLSGGSVLITQSGCNIILNIFCGVVVNAAYGIANQVSAAIYGFVSNFQLAFQPQIVKLHAENKTNDQTLLINRAALISYFLLLVISVPFFINADYVLGIWLKDVPKYSVVFCQLMLIYSLIDAIQAPLWMAINATGNIKYYSLWTSALTLLNLPIALSLLYIGMSPVWVFVVRVLVNMVIAVIRVWYVKTFLLFPSLDYFKMVLKKILPVTALSFGISYTIHKFMVVDFLLFIVQSVAALLVTCAFIYILGLSAQERMYIADIVKSKIHK